MTKILIATYYLVAIIFVLEFAAIMPFQESEGESITYMNARLSELKKALGTAYLDEKSEAVKEIFRAGSKYRKERYQELSAKQGFLAALILLVVTLLLPFTRLSDFAWIAGGFFGLYGLGALNTESLLGILLLALGAYSVKKRLRSSSEKSENNG